MSFHDRLFALDDDFQVFTAERARPDEAAVAALEAELGHPLEATYRAFLLELGCGAAVAKEEAWPRPKAFEVRPRWQHMYGFELLGLAGNAPPPLDVRARTRALEARGVMGQIAVLGMLGVRDEVVVDAAGTYAWVGSDGSREPIPGATFASIVAERVATLQADKDRFSALRAEMAPLDGAPDDIDDAETIEDEPMTETLIEALGSADGDVVADALDALIERDEPSLVEVLLDGLPHIAGLGRDGLVADVVGALGQHLPRDARILPAIAGLWRWSVDRKKTLMASNAVFDVLLDDAPHSPEAQAVFARAAADPDPYLQMIGHGALARTGGPLAQHVPALLAGLAHGTPSVQHHAERALAALGAAVRADVERVARDGDPGTQAAAARVLARLG